ncbi:SDR family oxidoreductase [Cryptosporangium sp. NPDC051539]|uniref:SDR family oxidoreductase n=1 Tax=Cryptosporangium sp. NPDC051539 TaxID=3363962 RepID=UPI0037938ACB
MRVVLVTGAGSGFGRLTVEALGARGHTVFAGLRGVGGRNEKAAAELTALGLRVVELDVLDQASADAAVAAVLQDAGRLDVVINNAGRMFAGPVEAFTAEEVSTILDVNVLGAVRVARAALPHLRRQGHGVLIQNGSLAGWTTVPYTGLYSAGKAAIRSLVEGWHHELAPFGVESVIVDAASYPTNIGANAGSPSDAERLAVYGEGFTGFMSGLLAHAAAATPGDPREVADAFVRLVEMRDGTRPFRTVVGPDAESDAVRAAAVAADRATEAVATGLGVASHLV